MKLFLRIAFVILLGGIFVPCEGQSWLWAKNGNASANGADAYPVATDNSGNVWFAGWFNSPAMWLDTCVLHNSGDGIFLAKYDMNENFLFVRSPLGNGMPTAISTDQAGNLYMTGYFTSDSIIFGQDTLYNSMTNYTDEIFVAKYDANGSELWARRAGGSGSFNEMGTGIATDAAGNVFVTGCYDSPSITFGSFTLTNNGNGSDDVFLTKYDTNGNVLWAIGAGNAAGDWSTSASTDAAGNVFITGQYGISITFGTFTLTGGFVFVAKYDPSGTALWARTSIGTAGNGDKGESCATDPWGNLYVTGYYSGPTFRMGADTIFNTQSGNEDIFLLKLKPNGALTWMKGGGGRAYDGGYSLASNSAGETYLSGFYGSYSSGDTLNFGTLTLLPPAPDGYDAGFLMKLDSSGNVLCGSSLYMAGDDNSGLAIDPLGDNVYMGTDLPPGGNPYYFGPDTVNGTGGEYPVLAKWTCSETGIISLTNYPGIKIYPNPTTGILHLDLSGKNFQKSQLIITDVLGKTILQSEIRDPKSEIDLSGNASGIYFYRVINDEKIVAAGKIILTK